MTKHDTPRDAEGSKLCAWCGEPIQQTGVGRSKDYCRRSCRQRAYEARRQREIVVAAVASAVVRRDLSRDETAGTGGVPVPAPARELPPRQSATTASAMPPWPSEEYGGEPPAQS
ncbi:hypothetical protein AB5J56_18350 [Streptomyces sp. R21]|uniref:SpdA protein n=1 Tax=Streptomyces sp. R21 TaxID=3238627 RepID=A0AB39P7U8_9ACTN